MNTETKLCELLVGLDFWDPGNVSSAGEYLKIVGHNLAEYKKMESRGFERFFDLISLFLAERLVPLAVARYGDAGASSLRALLTESTDPCETDAFIARQKQLIRDLLNDVGIDENQVAAIIKVVDSLPEAILDFIVGIISRTKVIPNNGMGRITTLLAQMMKEEDHAHDPGHNFRPTKGAKQA
jgi:hypothetical protein